MTYRVQVWPKETKTLDSRSGTGRIDACRSQVSWEPTMNQEAPSWAEQREG